MRGMGIQDTTEYVVDGLTPAGAGNGLPGLPSALSQQAYPRGCGEWGYDKTCTAVFQGLPRGCGEWTIREALIFQTTGLPPRVRGMDPRSRTTPATPRLTPAGAGNGTLCATARSQDGAYPRGCGEWVHQRGAGLPSQGLPPRVRGMGRSAPVGTDRAGLTPAGAGNGLW